MRALISHESRFQANAKNTQGSKGYMQLTSWPIKDLAARPQLFAPIFDKINLAHIPEEAPKVLKDLISVFKEGTSAYHKIHQLIPSLLANKNEPYTNMTI
jgi:hypothetical protein